MSVELIQLIKQIGADRGVDPEILFQAIESAVVSAARKNLSRAKELRAEIDRKSGEVNLYAQKTVVKTVEDDATQITRKNARKEVGQLVDCGINVEVKVLTEDLGRIAAQTAKQVVLQKIREAQRDNVYEEFKDRIGTVITGEVQRFEHEGIIVDISQTDAILPFREVPRNAGLHQSDRIRCLITEVRQISKGPQIVLSRTHPELVTKLFEQEVPEIADGTVRIESVCREAGDRAKIAVSCKDKNIDPVGACVGMKGSRVQMVVRELRGEKVDIVPWSADPAEYIANALNPAKIVRVKVEEKAQKAVVIVPEGQLSLAIGKHGQNARLASKLTGWNIDIISEKEDKERAEEKESAITTAQLRELGKKLAMTKAIGALEGVGEKVAERLIASGIASIEQLAGYTVEQLTAIEGIGEKKAHKIIESAKNAVEKGLIHTEHQEVQEHVS